MTHYELEVLGGDWGLASLQPASLAAVAYARMAGRGSSGSGSGSVSLQCVRRPLAVVSAPYPTLACAALPYLKRGQSAATAPTERRRPPLNMDPELLTDCKPSFSDSDPTQASDQGELRDKPQSLDYIIGQLREMRLSIDYDLDHVQAAEVATYVQFVQNALEPAVNYMLWVDDLNYSRVTRLTLSRILDFPHTQMAPKLLRHQAKLSVGSRSETEIYVNAQLCIDALAAKLGPSRLYFNGDAPGYLDAVVFGYLAVIAAAPVPSSFLRQHLDTHANLKTWLDTINKRYFFEEQREYQKRVEAEQNAGNFFRRYQSEIVAASVAGAAMTLFYFLHRRLPVPLIALS